MSESELFRILDGSGIPFVYHDWKLPENLPYGVLLFTGEAKFYADGEVFFSSPRYQVELYTKKKSPASEQKVERALTTAGIAYQKSEAYIESERLFQVMYEIGG